MELDSAADLAVLGGDDGCKPSHADLSLPAQPWAGAPQVALAEASPEALFLSEQFTMNYQEFAANYQQLATNYQQGQ
jgi:hypothetical protein